MKIKEFARVITGKTPSTKRADYWGDDVVFYTPEDIAKGYELEDSARHISNQGYDAVRNNTTAGISLLVGCIGSDMGNVAIVNGISAFNQQINAITDIDDDINPYYLYYYLSTQKSYLQCLAASTATPLLPKTDFEEIDIPIIGRPEQDQIVSLLKPIDDKIKLNKTIYSYLEGVIDSYFKYWFVQFDFPNDNGLPYKTTNGEMVWNEKLKREIPAGWIVKSIQDISTQDSVIINPISGTMYKHYSIQAFDENRYPNMEDGAAIDSGKYSVPANSILLSKLNPHFKRIWLVGDSDEFSICSTEFIPFTPIGVEREYLYALLNSDEFYTYMVNSSSSSTGSRKRMDPELCKIFSFCSPSDDALLMQFCEKIRPFVTQMLSVIKQNNELRELRDFLLPLAINGQLKRKQIKK